MCAGVHGHPSYDSAHAALLRRDIWLSLVIIQAWSGGRERLHVHVFRDNERGKGNIYFSIDTHPLFRCARVGEQRSATLPCDQRRRGHAIARVYVCDCDSSERGGQCNCSKYAFARFERERGKRSGGVPGEWAWHGDDVVTR